MQHTEKALLFDIQHLCLQDGPGVRTSLFFKGCPLRCLWCHNPESYTMDIQLLYLQDQCVHCGACVALCPSQAHSILNGRHELNREKCLVSGDCVKACCYGALSLVGRHYTLSDVMAELESDRPYFQKKDEEGQSGGVTLTGGEPMFQFGFVREFLRQKGALHVCMETSGFAPTEQYMEILPMVDLFLWDIKATDPTKHSRLCGQDNALILHNLRTLCDNGANIVLRLPLIPGVNDDDEHLCGIAKLLVENPSIRQAEIMAYHRLGVAKNDRLGREASAVDQSNANDDDKNRWLRRFEELGIRNIRIS